MLNQIALDSLDLLLVVKIRWRHHVHKHDDRARVDREERDIPLFFFLYLVGNLIDVLRSIVL